MATPQVQRGRAASHRFGVQMVAGMLALSVPMMVVIAAVLATQATDSLTTASERHGQSVARAVTVHVEDWVSERKENIAVIAARASGRLNDPAVAALAAEIDKTYSDFTLIELTDMTGTVVATSRPGTVVKPAGQDWFATAASGQPVLTSLTEHDGRLQWIVAQPVLGIDGRPAGVAVGYLDVTVLAGLLNPELDHSTDVVAVDAQHRLVYDTALGKVDSEALLKAGVLRTTVDNAATRLTATGQVGAAYFTDLHGHSVIGGFDTVDSLHWTILAQDTTSTVLAPVNSLRLRALVLVLFGTLLAAGFSIGFSRWVGQPLTRLTATASRAASGDLEVRAEPEGPSELIALA